MRRTGDAFEQRALAQLEHAGLALLERNYTTRFGELDLVMRDGRALVFVEVRYRRNTRFGGAAVSVTAAKRAKLVQSAALFLAARPQYADLECRFDVVAFEGPAQAPKCAWHRAAFDAF
ncbi:MAG TPA: YraN family protein [Rhodanobacteraceae bacterium]|nr:YraN family protein [Rhodanobacteraceae bacterium]